ncbi:MAG TPA: galactokinase family protein [Bacteroidales bacterium]|nr:galactokinase family protein [Bacteroidales bacterium]
MDRKKYTKVFQAVYGDNEVTLNKQFERYENLTNLFNQKFQQSAVKYFSTPGRTEIGGNHTDHNLGRVLAGSVNLDSIAAVSETDDNKVTIYSVGYKGAFFIDLQDLSMVEEERETTNALIRGIAARFRELGYNIGGFNAYFSSDVLSGSGLSSSASIEVLIGTIFNHLFNEDKISPQELAIIGQYAENEYFGKPCGLMDQVACAMGGIVTIDFEKPAEPVIEKIEFDFTAREYNLLVVNTGGSHADLTGDYAAVPAEMKAVAKEFGQDVLRGLKKDQLISRINELRSKTGDRAILRALHYFGDNSRVLEQVDALKKGDFTKFLGFVTDSGNSSFKWLQNTYTSKKVDEQGVSLALALSESYIRSKGAGACRVHGGGFAGTIQVFLPSEDVEGYRRMMDEIFGEGSVYVLTIRSIGTTYLAPDS